MNRGGRYIAVVSSALGLTLPYNLQPSVSPTTCDVSYVLSYVLILCTQCTSSHLFIGSDEGPLAEPCQCIPWWSLSLRERWHLVTTVNEGQSGSATHRSWHTPRRYVECQAHYSTGCVHECFAPGSSPTNLYATFSDSTSSPSILTSTLHSLLVESFSLLEYIV